MDTEKLSKANDLIDKISDVRKHINSMNLIVGKEKDSRPDLQYRDFYYDRGIGHPAVKILDEYLNEDEFLTLYIIRAEKHLQELEKQFAEL